MLWFYLGALAYFVILGTVVFAVFCSDVDAKGIVGIYSRFILDVLPNFVGGGIRRVFGQRVMSCCYGVYDYAVNKRNPILQIAYLTILNCCFATWIAFGIHQLPTYLVSEIHCYVPFLGMILCHWTFYKACYAGPGTITKENVKCFDHQPYDGLLYIEGLRCKTCNVRKVHY